MKLSLSSDESAGAYQDGSIVKLVTVPLKHSKNNENPEILANRR